MSNTDPKNESARVPLRLVTYNIRYANPTPVKGEEPWHIRGPKLCAQLKFLAAAQPSTFICLQEATYPQLKGIQAALGPSWAYIGCGRSDGKKGGEFNPIFYRPSAWDCLHSKTYWLSDTPDVPSKGWDAHLPRIVTTGTFKHTTHPIDPVKIMCTHLTYQGNIAKQKSADLLVNLARDFNKNHTVFLAGDFNSRPDSDVCKTLTRFLTDMREEVPEVERYGNMEVTYTSFGEPDEEPGRIDYLFQVRKKGVEGGSGDARGRVRNLTYGILSNRFDDGVFLSDHRAVVADLEIWE